MKRIHVALVITAALFVLLPSVETEFDGFGTRCAAGQETKVLNVTDAIELMRADMTAQKKNIVAHSLEMTESESEVFWRLYNEYQASSEKLNDRSVRLVKNLLHPQETLSDRHANDLLREFLSIEKERLALKEKYINKFNKELPARLVLTYFQLDNKLEAAMRWGFAEEIPLIK